MIKNPQTCWKYAIHTDKLREPAQSFEVLQILINNPSRTHKSIAEEKGIKQNKIDQWSMKYFYKERIQAYQKEVVQELFHAGINHNKKVIDAENERVSEENTLFKNDFITLTMKEKEIMAYVLRGETAPHSLVKEYEEMRQNYFKDKQAHIKRSKDIQEIATKPLTLTPQEVEELSTSAQEFLEAMKDNRSKHR